MTPRSFVNSLDDNDWVVAIDGVMLYYSRYLLALLLTPSFERQRDVKTNPSSIRQK